MAENRRRRGREHSVKTSTHEREIIRDQSEVQASIYRLREENAVLRAQIHAKTGKIPAAHKQAESEYGYDGLEDERFLASENEMLRSQLATAAIKPTTAPPRPAASTLTTPSAYAPDFSKMSLDELCKGVRDGKITESDAAKILDARFTKPSPLTALCRKAWR